MSALPHFMAQARVFSRQGRLAQAEGLYRKVLKLLPQHTQAHERLSALMMARGNHAQALPHLQALCRLQPKVTPHWVRLVHACQRLGEPALAQAALDQAQGLGLSAQLIAQLQATLSHPPSERQHHLLWQYQQGHVLTAEIAAHLFMGDYPEHPLGYQILGALLHDAGRLEEALDIKRQTVQAFAQDAHAWNNLACTQLALGDAQGAMHSAQQALKLDPSHASARQWLAQAQQLMPVAQDQTKLKYA